MKIIQVVFLTVLHLNKSIHLQSPAATSPPQPPTHHQIPPTSPECVPRHRSQYLKWRNNFKITLKNSEIIANDQWVVIQHLQQVQSIILKDHHQDYPLISWHQNPKTIIIIIGTGNIVRLYVYHIVCMITSSIYLFSFCTHKKAGFT